MKRISFAVVFCAFISPVILASIPVSSFIIRPEKLASDFYTQKESGFIMSSSDEDFSLPVLSNQKILSEKILNGRKEITLSTGNYPAPEVHGVSKYLRDTPYLNLQRREIREATEKFRNSKDPVKDISLFVYNHISDKKEGIPIIPAPLILKDRAGDCTEHSILTVALLRANGIPARAVVGIILAEYFGGNKDIFVYHMWVEAYRNGRWVLVDSTRPSGIRHNRYIGFTFHNLTTEAPIDYLNAISAIADVRIRQKE